MFFVQSLNIILCKLISNETFDYFTGTRQNEKIVGTTTKQYENSTLLFHKYYNNNNILALLNMQNTIYIFVQVVINLLVSELVKSVTLLHIF